MIRIETERLIIRDRTMDDLFDLHSILSDSKVMYFLEDIQTYSLQESRENLFESVKETKVKNRNLFFWGIYDKKSQLHLGEIGFTETGEEDKGIVLHLGYFLKEKFWGKGYTTEAAQAISDYAFSYLNCYKIETGCVKENVASEKVMKRLG